MGKRIRFTLVAALLGFGIASCEKLESPRPQQGGLPFEVARLVDAVPVEYGDAVGVTSHPQIPFSATIWFVKPDKSIVAVQVNTSTGQIYERVLTIPRR